MPSAFLLFTKPAKLVSSKASGRRHLGNHVRRRRAWQRPDRQRPDRQRPAGTSGRHVRQARPTGTSSHIYNKVPFKKDPRRVRPGSPLNGIEAEKRVRIPAGNAQKRAGNGKNRPLESRWKPHFPQENRFPAAIITKNDKFISLTISINGKSLKNNENSCWR